MQFDVGGEDADGGLEPFHVGLRDDGVGGTGAVAQPVAPRFVAYGVKHRHNQLLTGAEEGGAGDEGMVFDHCAFAEAPPDGLAGIVELGGRVDGLGDVAPEVVEVDALADVHGKPAGHALREQCGGGASPCSQRLRGVRSLRLGPGDILDEGGEGVGGGAAEEAQGLGGAGSATDGAGAPQGRGEGVGVDGREAGDGSEELCEALGHLFIYLRGGEVRLPEVEDEATLRSDVVVEDGAEGLVGNLQGLALGEACEGADGLGAAEQGAEEHVGGDASAVAGTEGLAEEGEAAVEYVLAHEGWEGLLVFREAAGEVAGRVGGLEHGALGGAGDEGGEDIKVAGYGGVGEALAEEPGSPVGGHGGVEVGELEAVGSEEALELGDGAPVFEGGLGAEACEARLEKPQEFGIAMSFVESHLWKFGCLPSPKQEKTLLFPLLPWPGGPEPEVTRRVC